ncbi:MAG: hypothetical protein WKF96_12270 [Solirubrobacteraceae bacterium]
MNDENPNPNPVPEPEPEQTERTGNAEAAKYRRQLRGVEAERDQLRTRLDDRDRHDVEKLAANRFTDVRDVWSLTSLDDMRSEDGLISLEKAQAEFSRIEQDRPHWVKQPEEKPEPAPRLNLHQGARTSVQDAGPSFGQALKGGR